MDTIPPVVLTDDERRVIVIGVLIAMLLAALDQTIVAPAVPTIGAALGGIAYLPWIVSAYFLTATAVTPLYGKLADIHGRRPVLFTAIGIFTAASVLCALATSLPMLIAGRALQGLGGGGLMALAQTVIGDIVPPRERGRYTVYISSIWATASIAGPTVGGFFAQHLHWSLIFWINVPLAALAIQMTNTSLRRLPHRRREHRLDYLGAVLVVAATVAIMLMLTWAGTTYAWSSPEILALAAGALVLAGAFAWHVLHAREPLIPLMVLRNPVIASGTLSIFFAMGVNVGIAVYIPLYLELVHGMGSSQAGLSLVGFLGSSVLGANIAGRATMSVRHYKRLAVGGVAVGIVAMAALAAGAGSLSFAGFEALLCVVGFGTGMQFPVTTVSVQNAAGPHDLGIATAMLAFLRSLGAALGVSVLGAIVLASGVVRDLGQIADPTGLRAGDASRAAAGGAFVMVFGVAAVSLALALVCLILMEELPLRGSAPASPER